MMHAWLLLAFLALPRAAPPPGYGEACTIRDRCRTDEVGDLCRVQFGDRDACRRQHARDGYVYRCRTRGASTWREVWCGPKRKGQRGTPIRR